MRLLLLLCFALAAGCGSPAPTSAPTSNPASTPTPSPTDPANLPTLTLPEHIAGIPPGEGILVEAHTPPESVPVGVEQTYALAHCGLISPIDIDGSLWDPVTGDNGQGGPLTEDQIGDLINATPVVLILVDHDTMLMGTQHGGRVLLTRHDGPRNYLGCM